MDTQPPATVAVSRRIAAPAGDIFRLLADPRQHPALDGSGMVRSAATTDVVRGAGDVFVMRMHNAMLGDYEMNNHVVAYEEDRLIGWEPAPGRGHPAAAGPGEQVQRWGHRWSFELVPDGPAATIVTERYDCSRVPDDARAAMDDGRIWVESMTATLLRLDEHCTRR